MARLRTKDYVQKYGPGTRLVKVGAFRYVKIKNKPDGPPRVDRYFIGSARQCDNFYLDVKQHLGATDAEMLQEYLGTRLQHYSLPRFAYQVIVEVYPLLSEPQQNQCEIKLDDGWFGPDE